MSIMVATGRGALAGVLLKNAEALEVMEKVDTLVVDKTGTLTEGKPRLLSIEVLAGQEETEVLRLAASLEQGSEHPLASAIVAAAQQKGLRLAAVEEFRSMTGKGVVGHVEGRTVALGNQKLFEEIRIDPGPLAERAEALRREGQTVMFVGIEGSQPGSWVLQTPSRSRRPRPSPCST